MKTAKRTCPVCGGMVEGRADKRYCSNQCLRKNYRKKNGERIRKLQRDSFKKNKAKILKRNLEWRKKNMESCKQRWRANYQKNREKIWQRQREDLESMKLSMMKSLRRIAYGQVLPEVVVRFTGKPSLLEIVSSLPLPDQKRLAAGEPVKLLTCGPDGKATHRMVGPLELAPEQVRQVFEKGGIRAESAQAVWLEGERRKAARAIPERIGEARIDVDRQGVTIGRKFVHLTDLEEMVRALKRGNPRRLT